jgi:hypothetical protein
MPVKDAYKRRSYLSHTLVEPPPFVGSVVNPEVPELPDDVTHEVEL